MSLCLGFDWYFMEAGCRFGGGTRDLWWMPSAEGGDNESERERVEKRERAWKDNAKVTETWQGDWGVFA